MYYIISKIFGSLLVPPGIVIVLLLASFILFFSRRRLMAHAFLGVAIGILYILSIEPTSYALREHLELATGTTSTATSAKNGDVIVILGGGAMPKLGYRSEAELSGSSWNRLWKGVQLYKELNGVVPLLYSGDSLAHFKAANEPLLAQNIAEAMGVPRKDFWLDTESRTTHESTVNVKRILDTSFKKFASHRIYLVTSARHMLRASEDFQRVDIETVPVPADFSTRGELAITIFSFLPSADQLNASVDGLHEFLGGLAYSAMDIAF